jgi:hypothetical protein
MNMFISKGKRILAALAITGTSVAVWGGSLFLSFGAANASYYFLFSCKLVALMAYAGSLALLPEVAGDE